MLESEEPMSVYVCTYTKALFNLPPERSRQYDDAYAVGVQGHPDAIPLRSSDCLADLQLLWSTPSAQPRGSAAKRNAPSFL